MSERVHKSVPSPTPNVFHSHLSASTDLIVAIVLIITGLVSILGNGVVLLTHVRKRKKLRAHDLMTVNLAVCDFGYSLLGAPCVVFSSLSHGWMLGDLGCVWYGFQGFLFGVGSLFTTCLISLDRCFKICSLRYGQWIEKSHVSLSITLVWVYTLFWASLPMFGFGSYGPEPYGTSCTINWWRMKSSLYDKIYIYLILLMCFIVPTLIILISYSAILFTVFRSGRNLASIPSSAVTHGNSKDLRLTKIAAVVCSSFLIAWTPYAIVSFYSALNVKDELEVLKESAEAAETSGAGTGHGGGGGFLDFFILPSLINWTSHENYGDFYDSWRNMTHHQYGFSGPGPTSGRGGAEHQAHRSLPSLRPEVSLIPAILAKSHCMINPFIYQIMNRDFRDDVSDMLCWGQEEGKRRRGRGRGGSESDGYRSSFSLSYTRSWRSRSTISSHSSVDQGNKERDTEKKGKDQTGPNQDFGSVEWASIDVTTLDTHSIQKREQGSKGKMKEKGLKEPTSRSMLKYEN